MIQLTLTCSLASAVSVQRMGWLKRSTWQPGQAIFQLRSTDLQTGRQDRRTWEVPATYMLLHERGAPAQGRYVVDWMAVRAMREALIQHLTAAYADRYVVRPLIQTICAMNLQVIWEVGRAPRRTPPPLLPDRLLLEVQLD